jgi:hypothetical protein
MIQGSGGPKKKSTDWQKSLDKVTTSSYSFFLELTEFVQCCPEPRKSLIADAIGQ